MRIEHCVVGDCIIKEGEIENGIIYLETIKSFSVSDTTVSLEDRTDTVIHIPIELLTEIYEKARSAVNTACMLVTYKKDGF